MLLFLHETYVEPIWYLVTAPWPATKEAPERAEARMVNFMVDAICDDFLARYEIALNL
jgi:hypothetical protein